MYVSDYGYAASSNYWLTELSSYNNANVTANNWMYMGLWEWTLTPQTDRSDNAFAVFYFGSVNEKFVFAASWVNNILVDVASASGAARPVLYLKSTIAYGGGSGTAAKPILIN